MDKRFWSGDDDGKTPKEKEKFNESVRRSREPEGFVPREGHMSEEEQEAEVLRKQYGWPNPPTPRPPRDMRLGKARKDPKRFSHVKNRNRGNR